MMRQVLWMTGVLFLVSGWASPGALGDDRTYRSVSGTVRIKCPLTVGGSFEAISDQLTGNVQVSSGQIIGGGFELPIAGLDTGIGLRNTHLREKYLD